MRKVEAVTPLHIVERLLQAAGDELVLVGGQALAFWVTRYGVTVPGNIAAISADTDFLARSSGDRQSVVRMAEVLHGKTEFPSRRALTALVGQAYLDINDDGFINVDVIHKVIGLSQEAIRRRAVRVELEAASFLVMHPLDVLGSRLANLHKLAEKQNPKGRMQLALGIDMVREFIRAEAHRSGTAGKSERSPLQPFVSEVERLALSDAGRKVAARFALHVADAIDPRSIPAGVFWLHKWPQLSRLMSSQYAAGIATPP